MVQACRAQLQLLLTLPVRIGVLARERQRAQPLQIAAQVFLAPALLRRAPQGLSETLDYRSLHRLIVQECDSGHVDLIETLAWRLAERLMALPGVGGAKITLCKPKALAHAEASFCLTMGRCP